MRTRARSVIGSAQIAAVGRHVGVAVGGSRRLAATHVVVQGLNPSGKDDPGTTRPGSPRRFDSDRQRRPFARRRVSLFGLVAVAVVVVAAVAIGVGGRGGGEAVRYVPRGELRSDPLAFTAGRAAGFERAAAEGLSQVIYAKSPGGVLAAAARTASFRPLVERATAGTGIDPNLVEAIVMLESAGRPDAIAGGDPAGAAGLTQIVAGTASSFLGMRVELAASRRLTSRIERARAARQAREGVAAGGGAQGDRRPLRSGAGARRDGALPLDGAGALRPRRSGGGLVPHGDRQPRERAARLRTGARRRADRSDRPRRRAFLRAGLLRLLAGRPPGRVAPAGGVRRRLEDLLLAGARRRADHAPLPTRTRCGWKRSPTSTNARRAPKRCSTRCPSPQRFLTPDAVERARDGRACCSRFPTIRS